MGLFCAIKEIMCVHYWGRGMAPDKWPLEIRSYYLLTTITPDLTALLCLCGLSSLNLPFFVSYLVVSIPILFPIELNEMSCGALKTRVIMSFISEKLKKNAMRWEA